VTWC
jgi:hypothetical protein